jgi:hypothetical protein
MEFDGRDGAAVELSPGVSAVSVTAASRGRGMDDGTLDVLSNAR